MLLFRWNRKQKNVHNICNHCIRLITCYITSLTQYLSYSTSLPQDTFDYDRSSGTITVFSVSPWVTFVITMSLSFSLLEESDEEEQVVEVLVARAGATFLHAGHFQLVLWLLGIRFKLRQARWKYFPFLQLSPWHWTNLSVGVGFALQMQMLPHFIAVWSDTTVDCGDFLVFLFLLNWGSLQQWGQYQILSIVTEKRERQEGWNLW